MSSLTSAFCNSGVHLIAFVKFIFMPSGKRSGIALQRALETSNGSFSTMATKNSIKDVARVEKLPLDVSNALCKAIPERLPDGMKMNLTNAIKCTPELQDAEVSEDIRGAQHH